MRQVFGENKEGLRPRWILRALDDFCVFSRLWDELKCKREVLKLCSIMNRVREIRLAAQPVVSPREICFIFDSNRSRVMARETIAFILV